MHAVYPQPRIAAIRLLQDPRLISEIESAIAGRLRSELAPKSLLVLDEILTSKGASRTLKLAAAKTALDRAGYVPPNARDQMGDPIKSLAEQGPDELKAFIHVAQEELAQRAKPVIDGEAKEVKPAKHGRKPAALQPASDAELAGLLN